MSKKGIQNPTPANPVRLKIDLDTSDAVDAMMYFMKSIRQMTGVVSEQN